MNYFTRYVTSEKRLLEKIKQYTAQNVTPILDYAVEHNDTKASVEAFVKKKIELVQRFPLSAHSLKLSSLGLHYKHFMEVMNHYGRNGCTCLLDAEDYLIQETIDLQANKAIVNLPGKNSIFKTYQMYRKDSMEHLLEDIEMFRTLDITHNIKLVRGAYTLQDKKYGIIHHTKADTDANYNDAVRMLLNTAAMNPKMNVIFATHNKDSIDLFYDNKNKNFYHAVLMGMDHHLQLDNPNYTINRMVHVPFGPLHRTYPYMLRRLSENNAVIDSMLEKLHPDFDPNPKTQSRKNWRYETPCLM